MYNVKGKLKKKINKTKGLKELINKKIIEKNFSLNIQYINLKIYQKFLKFIK